MNKKNTFQLKLKCVFFYKVIYNTIYDISVRQTKERVTNIAISGSITFQCSKINLNLFNGASVITNQTLFLVEVVFIISTFIQ